jgi:hypothetical protein
MGTGLDRLAIGRHYLIKDAQPQELARSYAHLLPAD